MLLLLLPRAITMILFDAKPCARATTVTPVDADGIDWTICICCEHEK